jgi:hypothetical protein
VSEKAGGVSGIECTGIVKKVKRSGRSENHVLSKDLVVKNESQNVWREW